MSRLLVGLTSRRWRKVVLTLVVPLKTLRQFEEGRLSLTLSNKVRSDDGRQRYLVEVFLKKKASFDISESFSATAGAGDLDLMQFLFDREVLELDFTTFKYWDYALSLSSACQGNHPEVIKFLLDKGASDHHLALDQAWCGRMWLR